MDKLKKYLLKDIAVSQTGPFGSQLHEKDYVQDGTPIVTVEHLGEIGFYTDNLPLVSDNDKSRLSKYTLKEGDIVFSRVGSIDRCTYVSKKEEGWLFSGRCLRVRFNEKADAKYISYYFRQKYFKEMMLNISVGATMPSLNTTLMDNIPLFLPSKDTQQKIAAVLSSLDAKIELNQRINAELESMVKTLYDYWFVQFDFPNEKGKPYKSAGGKMVWNEELKREIPLGWEVYELSKIVSRISTGLNPRKNFVFGNGNNYYVTIKNIDYGKVILDDKCDKIDDEALKIIDRRSDLQIGDILFTSIEPVGKTYLLQEKPKNWNINESVFTIRPNYEMVTSEYLYSLLSSDMIKSFTNQSSAGSTFKGIRIGILKKFLFAYHNKNLINYYSKVVKPIIKKIDILQKESQMLTNLRDWLLPMLMNGQVKVKGVF